MTMLVSAGLSVSEPVRPARPGPREDQPSLPCWAMFSSAQGNVLPAGGPPAGLSGPAEQSSPEPEPSTSRTQKNREQSQRRREGFGSGGDSSVRGGSDRKHEQSLKQGAESPGASEAALKRTPVSRDRFQGAANSAVASHAAHRGLTGLTTGTEQQLQSADQHRPSPANKNSPTEPTRPRPGSPRGPADGPRFCGGSGVGPGSDMKVRLNGADRADLAGPGGLRSVTSR